MLLVDATVLVFIAERWTGLVGRDAPLELLRELVRLVCVGRRLVFTVVVLIFEHSASEYLSLHPYFQSTLFKPKNTA